MKAKLFSLLFLCCLAQMNFSQTWNLPARSVTAMNGTQFAAAITSLSFTARENLILQQILNGNVPSFYRTLKPVTSYGTVSGQTDSVTYYVTPDYLAVGHDTDYFLCPMSPMIATQIGDSTGCTLPTRKMVNDIYAAAAVKLSPQTLPPGPGMTTVPYFAKHDSLVWNQRSTLIGTNPLGDLTGGDKKDVIISNMIYNASNRVIIYGWHQSIGNPIQPMSNIHSDTYMDYSHGIRLVQNAVVYNGASTTVKAILQSSVLNPLLSDEGAMPQPQYPYSNIITSLSMPVSFALINNQSDQLEIKVSNDANATHYKVFTSTDGMTFNSPLTLAKTNLTLTGLTSGQTYFVKIAAYNQPNNITSSISEVLAAVPSLWQDSVLLVNGFDRPSAGNTYNFVIQHANALTNLGFTFSSASNEAIQNNLVSLSAYKCADWISGKESSANETFNSTEQTRVQNFLDAGGFLFVSGSEIGWDLDNLGSSADKSFYNNYLKADYTEDAPNNQASTWYTCANPGGGIFSFTGTLQFDNGSNGTYNVDYPDVISPMSGSSAGLNFTSDAADYSCVYFSGNFPSASAPGKLVYLTFPFETIYSSAMRDTVMSDVMEYFLPAVSTSISASIKSGIILYPNPAENYISFAAPSKEEIKVLAIYDIMGNNVWDVKLSLHSGRLDISTLAPGPYVIKVIAGKEVFQCRLIKSL